MTIDDEGGKGYLETVWKLRNIVQRKKKKIYKFIFHERKSQKQEFIRQGIMTTLVVEIKVR